MANVHPYLSFNNTKEALDYYKEVLGATNIYRVPVSVEQAEQFGITDEKLDLATMHSQFDILGTTIMAADNFSDDILSYSGFSILLDLNSEDDQELNKAKIFWRNATESGQVKVNMPFEEQFWGGAMGDFIDKYGVRWLLHAQPYSKIKK